MTRCLLAFFFLAGAASGQTPPRELSLRLPSGIDQLPKAPSTTSIVFKPTGYGGDFTYHHNPVVAFWKGHFYVAWTTAPRSEYTMPYRALLSTSKDGATWSAPIDPFASGDDAFRLNRERYSPTREGDRFKTVNCCPRNFLVTPDRLYLWGLGFTDRDSGKDWSGRIAYTDDGTTWHEISPDELDRLEKEQGLGELRIVGSNKSFAHLRDGRLLAACTNSFPTTTDPTGLSQWKGPAIDLGDCKSPGEPNCYEGPDGVLHGLIRDGDRIWHTYSSDAGQTWSRLTRQQNFPDNPGNKDFGLLPNGWVWYIGGPVPGSRQKLVLGLSRDGWTFDRNYLVRWEDITPLWPSTGKSDDRPGYEYPAALVHDGSLYVFYSRTRDDIEVSKIKLADILP